MAHITPAHTEISDSAASHMEVAAPAVSAKEGGEAATETMHEMIAADEATHAETAHAEASGGLPQLNFDTYPSQIFWLAILFTMLYVVMHRSLLPRIHGVLENRANRIQQDLDRAEHYQQQATAARETFEKTQNDARAHVQSVMDDVQKRAKEKADAKAHEVDAALRVQMTEAESAIATARTRAIEQAKASSETLANAIVERIMQPGSENAARPARRA